MKEYTLEDIRSIARPVLGEETPLVLFRILRIIGTRSLLGETSGQMVYAMGKSIGNMLGAQTIEEAKKTIRDLKVGIPEVEVIDEDHVRVKLYECITCAGFPVTGEMFCDMESGMIAGLLEKVYGRKAKSTQTASWSVGYDHCEFEVILY